MNYSIKLIKFVNYLLLFLFLLLLIGDCCGNAASSCLSFFRHRQPFFLFLFMFLAIASNARLNSGFFDFARSPTRSPPSFVTVSVYAVPSRFGIRHTYPRFGIRRTYPRFCTHRHSSLNQNKQMNN